MLRKEIIEKPHNNRCPFCQGTYVLKVYGKIACQKCDRSTDIEYERYVQREQKTKEHHNWHGRFKQRIKKGRKKKGGL